jgi:hypothetical protein
VYPDIFMASVHGKKEEHGMESIVISEGDGREGQVKES